MPHNYNFNHLDLDWFVADIAGNLFHFTSAGGYVPDFIEDGAESLSSKILELPEVSKEMVLNPNLHQIASIANEQELNDYIWSYAEQACRGFFTYDKTSPHYLGSTYYLVASPAIPLKHAALPAHIRSRIPMIDSELLTNSSQAPLEIVVEELRLV